MSYNNDLSLQSRLLWCSVLSFKLFRILRNRGITVFYQSLGPRVSWACSIKFVLYSIQRLKENGHSNVLHAPLSKVFYSAFTTEPCLSYFIACRSIVKIFEPRDRVYYCWVFFTYTLPMSVTKYHRYKFVSKLG